MIFCRGGLMFSWQSKWEHAGVGRKTTSVELARKNLADLHCKFFMQHRNKKTSPAVRKIITGQRAFFLKKNCTMSAEKYQSGPFHDLCRLLSFLVNPWMKFAWCKLGNVWSASSGDASFLDLDRSSLHVDVSYPFFRSISVNNVFFCFCRGGPAFSWPPKWEEQHASVGRNEPSVGLARKNLADLRFKFFRQHQNKKLPLP